MGRRCRNGTTLAARPVSFLSCYLLCLQADLVNLGIPPLHFKASCAAPPACHLLWACAVVVATTARSAPEHEPRFCMPPHVLCVRTASVLCAGDSAGLCTRPRLLLEPVCGHCERQRAWLAVVYACRVVDIVSGSVPSWNFCGGLCRFVDIVSGSLAGWAWCFSMHAVRLGTRLDWPKSSQAADGCCGAPPCRFVDAARSACTALAHCY